MFYSSNFIKRLTKPKNIKEMMNSFIHIDLQEDKNLLDDVQRFTIREMKILN